jgi:N-acetylneuraminic acid mutarotase
VYDGKVYVFGGAANADILNDVYEYDPTKNAWSARASMPIASFDMQAHAIGNYIYVVAGYGNSGFMNELLRYDPANDTWTARTPKPTYRYQFTSIAVDGRLYVIGGEGTIDDGPWASGKPWAFKDLVEVYDPSTDEWTRDDAAPMPFAGASSCMAGGAIYIFGGVVPVAGEIERNRAVEAFTMKFDPALGTWSTGAPMPDAAEGANCVSVGGEMYVIGGRSGGAGAMNSVRRYDPGTNTWTTPSRLPSHRYWGVAAASDEIFILGGLGSDDALFNAVEIFDPSP